MSDITQLTAQYLVGASDGPPVPQQFDNSLITPLIDAVDYNAALDDALALVGTGATPAANAGQFILIHNWWLGLAGGKYDQRLIGSVLNDVGSIQLVESDPYFLDGPLRNVPVVQGGTRPLIDVLIAKAKAGVDVRVMGWVLTGISSNLLVQIVGGNEMGQINGITLKAIQKLRAEPTIGMKAIVNDIAHPGGAAHTKMVVVGTPSRAIAFTGGIDFDNQRYAEHFHHPTVVVSQGIDGGYWHDVMAKVEGPAVRGVYEWYRSIWEEVRVRAPRRDPSQHNTVLTAQVYRVNSVSVLGHGVGTGPDATPPLAAYSVPDPSTPVGQHRVQNLRTVPQFNFAAFNVLPSPPPISFAPNGLFEFRTGLRKAISGARKYIYLEDQAIYSQEIMSWIHDAVVANSDLKVILVSGAQDPNDKKAPPYFATAINDGLLTGINPHNTSAPIRPLTDDERSRVRFCSRLDEIKVDTAAVTSVTPITTPSGTTYTIVMDSLAGTTVAADVLATNRGQLQIGDNKFPLISNPAMTASSPLTFVVGPDKYNPSAFVAPTTTASADLFIMRGVVIHAKITVIDDACAVIGSANCMRRSLFTDMENSVAFVDPTDVAVKEFRVGLWHDHFGNDDPTVFEDLDASLHSWNPQWGVAGAAPPLPVHIIINDLPIVARALTHAEFDKYNEYEDEDSQENWGGCCPLPGVHL